MRIKIEDLPLSATTEYRTGRRLIVYRGSWHIGDIEVTTEITNLGREAGMRRGICAKMLDDPRQAYPSAFGRAFRTIDAAKKAILLAEKTWIMQLTPTDLNRVRTLMRTKTSERETVPIAEAA